MAYLYGHEARFSASWRTNVPDHPFFSMTGGSFEIEMLYQCKNGAPPTPYLRQAITRFDNWLSDNWNGRVLLQRSDVIMRDLFDSLARDHYQRRPFYLESPPTLANLSEELLRVGRMCLTDPARGDDPEETPWRLQRVRIARASDGRWAQSLGLPLGEEHA